MVDMLDVGGRAYRSKKAFETSHNPLYRLIASDLAPDLAIDVGANYGLVTCALAKSLPAAAIVAVEPSLHLVKYLKHNIDRNCTGTVDVVQALCSDVDKDSCAFSLNPLSSQDNRVVAPHSSWRQQMVPSTTLSAIIGERHAQRVFIKVDVQGYEQHVFRGFSAVRDSGLKWVCEMEFAPKWLESQGTDPVLFLRELLSACDAVEVPARLSFGVQSLDSVFRDKLDEAQAKEFVAYVTGLAENNEGWTDLLLRPSCAA